MGYYKDQRARTIELAPEIRPMKGCTPMKLMISELIEATPKEAEEEAPKTTPATVKQGLAARNSRPNGPEDLSWADGGSLSLTNKDHRDEGLWAFDTCNPNAWAGAKKYLERTQADFVVVREAKIASRECVGTEQPQGTLDGRRRLVRVQSLRLMVNQLGWLSVGGHTLG